MDSVYLGVVLGLMVILTGLNLACYFGARRAALDTLSARKLVARLDDQEESMESIRLLVRRKIGRESQQIRRDNERERGPDPEANPQEWLKFQQKEIQAGRAGPRRKH